MWWDENVEVFAEAFHDLKQQGKIRFAGISTNAIDALKHFDRASAGGLEVLQVGYSLINRGPEKELLPYCQAHDIDWMTCGSLGWAG